MKMDGNLLIDLKNGDEKAFETLFWEYNQHVYHFVYSLLYDKSMAADLTQNVFLKIWEKHETIDPEQNFDAYLFTIARNLVYKETENRLLSEDWSGKCICRLVTDIKLFNICVTNDDKELIALGWDDDYHLYSFDLSKVTFTW